MLQKSEHEVVGEAENGRVAVEKYRELKPDIVTMDITMPEMDGLAALKAIRAEDPNAKIIMVSAMGQEAMVRDAVLNGARGFIVKPFKEDGILAAINKLL
jgi:two-component system chemotaxis response regulator CheY